jgi:glutamate--cysteine ligase
MTPDFGVRVQGSRASSMIGATRQPRRHAVTELQQRLRKFGVGVGGIRRGIEKESLRVLSNGSLALTPHPRALGSPLTHPCITTDFSESQLELITGVHTSAESCLRELKRIHQHVYRAIDDELLWVASMPCGLPADETIPIGQYGTSNIGRSKSVYRMGLGHRYGRRMQTISGIHYNWSMPGLKNEDYFGLIRNFRRHSFLLLYLFGASPAVCSSFVSGRQHRLEPIGTDTLHLPHATSLRMGRLGYQSDAQASLAVSYNSLDSYAASLHDALTTPHAPYEKLGILNPGGEYNQLATTLLQIENEFYGTIRPKRVIRPAERPLHALRERGVEYVEVRCLDLDPFEPIGIGASTLAFLDVFLLHCVATDSPPDTPAEIAALSRNQHLTAERGREPGLHLERNGKSVALVEWGAELLEQCSSIAITLDQANGGGGGHAESVERAAAGLRDPDRLPSAQVLRATRLEHAGSHTAGTLASSQRSRQLLMELPFPASQRDEFERFARLSLSQQSQLEAAETLPFEEFRRWYLDPARLRLP